MPKRTKTRKEIFFSDHERAILNQGAEGIMLKTSIPEINYGLRDTAQTATEKAIASGHLSFNSIIGVAIANLNCIMVMLQSKDTSLNVRRRILSGIADIIKFIDELGMSEPVCE